jgi:exosome complex component CSL4
MKKIVIPGDKLATIEEYIIKEGAYEDKQGFIRSLYLGSILIDPIEKNLAVRPLKKLKLIDIGDTTIGRISNFSGIYAYVDIFVVNNNVMDRKFTGTLHPPRYRNNRDISRMYKFGDYIYAEVISKANRTIHLSIEKKEFGVILAFCSLCGRALVRDKKSKKVKCKVCNRYEDRKLSTKYGKLL